ncbi:MAG: allophanate hydrolase [Hyphomicrobiales bacterium]|nr:MAG: allophanate hydrolase [Hyphomicrobiales bacterium]
MSKREIPLDLAGLKRAYARGLSPAAVIEDIYDTIERVADPGIFITLLDKKKVLKTAQSLRKADRESQPLWGIPFVVKDNIDVAGLKTSAAAPAFATKAKRNATAVQKLLDAGAILVGKTNLDQFATGLVGVRTPLPVPKNSFDAKIVPGGSSSGSAVAVARGMAVFSLGTDTAGSGRVPAGLNNIVGLKPSVGAVSSVGMLPACRTLDCISVFAGTVDDAWAVYEVIAGADAEDAFSRPIALGALGAAAPKLRLGVPRAKDLLFFGDAAAKAHWKACVALAEEMGAELVDVDFTPLFETAALLYDGPWVAERYQALREIMETRAADLHPVTRAVIEKAKGFSAADAFAGRYRLEELKRAAERLMAGLDALMVPTAPYAPSVKDLDADPIVPNMRLGTYTNFVNLLDMCALAVPGPMRKDGLPAGITLIGNRGRDGAIASIGRVFQHKAAKTMGATGRPLPPLAQLPAVAPAGMIEIAVVGAHLSGMALNHEVRSLGGVFVRAVETEPCYELYALPGGPPKRPGLIRVAAGTGHAIATEVWAMPADGFGRFVAGIPAPLGIGTLQLADGTRPKGFLCEAEAVRGAKHISSFGGWRAFMAAHA